MEKKKKESNIKFDLASGLVVFFVALPLCLGISLASTAHGAEGSVAASMGSAIPGIIAGVIGGIIVGFSSGSRFGVSGPAAGLITIVSAAIITFGGFDNGGFEKFILAVAIAGVIQLIFGFLKGGVIAYYIPFSVIKGMLAGIGITILLKEIPHFFGYDKDVEGDWGFDQMDGENTFTELWNTVNYTHTGATIVAIISLLILIFWGSKMIKKSKILSLIPGPLLAIIVSIGVSLLFLSGDYAITGTHLVNVPEPKNVEEFQDMFFFPDFSALNDPRVYGIALVIAIVASIETLLCVEATDKMDPYKGRTPMNKELKAQGLGNLLSGLIGGLPITQVIVRSTANISAGAKSKNSAIIHGVFLVIFIVAIPGVLNLIPRATLAAILLLIGWKLASPKSIVAMWKAGFAQFIPFVTVIAVMHVPGGDLLKGVGAGLVVAFIIILFRHYQFDLKKYKLAFFKDINESNSKEVIHLELAQHASFLNKVKILRILDEIEDGKEVVIDLSNVAHVDYDIAEAIKDFKISCEERKINLEIIHAEKLGGASVGH
ncbi:MAG: SulP family inorganic anion transporter [Crocinitomicaceae bacterium]